MCTVSWYQQAAAYEVFFNRDERHTRQPAIPPSVQQRDGIAYLGPRDRDRGGTWLAVNAVGLTLGTLNLHPDSPPPLLAIQSRGMLVHDLITCRRAAEVGARLGRADLSEFAPFTLLAISLADEARAWAWDGRKLCASSVPADMPLSSSSFESAAVIASRRRVFAEQQAAHGAPSAWLDAFHRSHLPERGPYSVCMHRPDANTVSYSRVRVTPKTAALTYHAGPPCEAGADVVTTLSLIRERAR